MSSSIFEEIITTTLNEFNVSYDRDQNEEITSFYFPIKYKDGGAIGVVFFNNDVPILSLRAVLDLPIENNSIVATEFKIMINRINHDIAFFRTYLNSDYNLEIAGDFEFVESAENIQDIIRFYITVLFALPGQVDDELKDMLKFMLEIDD